MSTPSPLLPLPALSASDPQGLWTRFQQLLWHDPDLGFWLDASRMAISQADLHGLEPRFQEAFAAMEALEAGAIANRDEERQVGHY